MQSAAVIYRIVIRRAYRYVQRARDTRDLMYEYFREVTEGMKELKLHAARREGFFSEQIATTTEALQRDALTGVRHHVIADTWSQLLFYGLVGAIGFAAPAVQGLEASTLTGYVVVILYAIS